MIKAGLGICSAKSTLKGLPGAENQTFGLHFDGKLLIDGCHQKTYANSFDIGKFAKILI